MRTQHRGSRRRNHAHRRGYQGSSSKGEVCSSGLLAPARGWPVGNSGWRNRLGGFACRGSSLVFYVGCIMKQSGLSTRELRQRHFPQVVIFIICMVFLLATIMTAISWITIPRATIMASVLIVGLTAAMAYKTFVAQNIAYSTNFTIVCSLILMAGIAGAQWGTEKFMPALIATLTVSAIMTIRQARSTSSRIRP